MAVALQIKNIHQVSKKVKYRINDTSKVQRNLRLVKTKVQSRKKLKQNCQKLQKNKVFWIDRSSIFTQLYCYIIKVIQYQMFLIYPLTLITYLGYALQRDCSHYYLLITLAISLLYQVQRHLREKDHSLRRLLKRDFPSHALFLIWLYFFKVPYLMHYIPLILNSSGKVIWLVRQLDIENVTLIQQLIVFQSQSEAFVSLHLFISALTLDHSKILQFVTYALILKIKYRFYAPAHKAFNEIHFRLDRISRYFNFRAFYHYVYKVITCFTNDPYFPANNFEMLY